MKLLIAGGGTGGHVLAGIAVAEAWCKKWGKTSQDVLFVGAVGGMEEKLVPRAGYPLSLLRVGGLNRVGLRLKVKTLLQLPLAFLQSIVILLRHRPQYVLGVGGFASGPLVLMASLLGRIGSIFGWKVRVAILEQNSVPGITNRILSRFVDRIFTTFTLSEFGLPQSKIKLTGNPVRQSMSVMPSAVRNPMTVFVFGGSRGAFGMSSLVLDALPHLADLEPKIHWIHQTGEADYDRVHRTYEKYSFEARVERFIDDMPKAYQRASLLICRAGSSTLAEVAAVGRAAILVPLPTAADNHQEMNARVLSDVGAAVLFKQNQSSGEDLAKLIREFYLNPKRISQMEQSVRQFDRPRAAEEIAETMSPAVY